MVDSKIYYNFIAHHTQMALFKVYRIKISLTPECNWSNLRIFASTSFVAVHAIHLFLLTISTLLPHLVSLHHCMTSCTLFTLSSNCNLLFDSLLFLFLSIIDFALLRPLSFLLQPPCGARFVKASSFVVENSIRML